MEESYPVIVLVGVEEGKKDLVISFRENHFKSREILFMVRNSNKKVYSLRAIGKLKKIIQIIQHSLNKTDKSRSPKKLLDG